jgi:hypothetical protein
VIGLSIIIYTAWIGNSAGWLLGVLIVILGIVLKVISSGEDETMMTANRR